MPVAILSLTIGAILAYSALKGKSVTDILSGVTGDVLNPAGGKVAFSDSVTTAAGITVDSGTINADGTGSHWGAMQAEMDRITALRRTYQWGGGHGKYTDTGPWDCSGAISQVLHHVGLLTGGPLTSTGLMTWGKAGRGTDFTVYANPAHTFLIAESGPHKGQAWGTNRTAPGGGASWHHHTIAGFVARSV